MDDSLTANDGLRHEDFRLVDLRLPEPALRACASAGLTTVRALAAASNLPAELDPETRDLARDTARRFLESPLPIAEIVELDLPIGRVLYDRRVLPALRAIGVTTVGQALACPRSELLAIRGFGPRSLERTLQAIRFHAARTSTPPDLLDWLPESVLGIHLDALCLPTADRIALAVRGACTVRDLLSGRGPDDARLRELVRASIARIAGTERAAEQPRSESFLAGLGRFRSGLDDVELRLFDQVLGIGRRPVSLVRAALALRLPTEDAEECERRLRARLQEVCGELVERLATHARAAFSVQEGVFGVDDLATGTELHAAAQASPDAGVPLRLLAFCRPDLWSFEADRLCARTADEVRLLVRTIRRALRGARPPVRVEDLTASAREVLPDCPIGLVLHVLRRVLGYSVALRPDVGEVVTVRRTSMAARLEALIEDAEGPVALDDLLFRYRDRHGRGSRRRIADALCSGTAFLEVGPASWSLQARHLDELELLRPESERIAAETRRTGARVSTRDRVRRGEISERTGFLLTALLRRMPELRPLGRGDFVARSRPMSDATAAVVNELRRAMGEIPHSRFLQNQPPQRRRLVGRLLRQNRLFVSPARDRIDLADNYPLTGDRLLMLLREVRCCVEEASGYAPIATVQDALRRAELGGEYLTDHLLLDIIRRHGEFELLPGPWIAVPGMGLGRWIQRTTRDVLRSHVTGLTQQQIVAERPELAEFTQCLADLLDQDPLVQSEDGLHYQLA